MNHISHKRHSYNAIYLKLQKQYLIIFILVSPRWHIEITLRAHLYLLEFQRHLANEQLHLEQVLKSLHKLVFNFWEVDDLEVFQLIQISFLLQEQQLLFFHLRNYKSMPWLDSNIEETLAFYNFKPINCFWVSSVKWFYTLLLFYPLYPILKQEVLPVL